MKADDLGTDLFNKGTSDRGRWCCGRSRHGRGIRQRSPLNDRGRDATESDWWCRTYRSSVRGGEHALRNWARVRRSTALLFATITFLSSSFASAGYREPCLISFQIPADCSPRRSDCFRSRPVFSDAKSVQCNYVTGTELKNAARSPSRFSESKVYALVRWPPGFTTVIRISESLLCGSAAEPPCARTISRKLHGRDQLGHNWLICQPGSDAC